MDRNAKGSKKELRTPWSCNPCYRHKLLEVGFFFFLFFNEYI